MPRKRIDVRPPDALDTSEHELPSYSSGAVCEVLGIEPRRLHNYLDSRSYRLSPSGKLGEGRGQRHYFETEDVYRLAIAHHLFRDGFSPRLISELLERMDDADFFAFDENGRVPHPVVVFRRGKEAVEFDLLHRKRVPAVTVDSAGYYLLDVAGIVDEVDRRLEKLRKAATS